MAAVIYFVSFTIICAFIVLNLFLAIVLDNYSALMSGTALTSADVADFQALWMDLDTEGTGFIPARMLLPVLEVLPPPLGKATVDAKSGRCLRAPRAAVTEILQSLEAEAFEIGGFVGPMVFYKDVLVALTCLHFSVSTSALPASVLSSVTDKCRALRQSQAHDALR